VLYQLAASLVLLAVTGFIVRGFQRQNEIDLGFQPTGVYMLSVDPGRDGYSAKQSRVFLDQLLQKVRELPGIRSASLTETVPLRLSDSRTIGLQPRDGSQAGQSDTMLSTVGPGYFETLGIPIRRGRAFRSEDTVGRSSAIINETLARDLWPGRTAVGNVVRAGDHDYEVVGVVADGKYGIILESRQRCVYLPMPWNPYEGQSPRDGITLLVRAAPGFRNVLPALQRLVHNVNPHIAVFNAKSMREHVDDMLALVWLAYGVYGGLGLLGLALATIGLYGVSSFSAAQRTKEIGIRIALGARPGQIMRLVISDALVIVSVAVVLGEFVAFAVTRVLSSVFSDAGSLIQTSATDPVVLLGPPLLLAIAALVACYVPARRAIAVEPIAVLRHE
jgi:predicted permease